MFFFMSNTLIMQCKNLADHLEEIVQQILNEITPGNICVELKLCNGTEKHGNLKRKFEKIFSKGEKSLQKKRYSHVEDIRFYHDVPRFS